jgi:hypothetical protein
VHLTLLPPFETYPRLVSFAQSPIGKIIIVLFYSLILFLVPGFAMPREMAPLFLMALAFLPDNRRTIIFIGGLLCADSYLFHFSNMLPSNIGSVVYGHELQNIARTLAIGTPLFALSYFPRTEALRKEGHWIAAAAVAVTALFAFCIAQPLKKMFWVVAITWTPLIWNFGCATRESGELNLDKSRNRPIFLLPAWGLHYFPIPASPSQLNRFEARTERDFTISQLKGLKLAIWCLIIFIVHDVVAQIAFQSPIYVIALTWLPSLHLPNLDSENLSEILVMPIPAWKFWCSLILRSWLYMAFIASTSGMIVSFARMCGYCIFRHTYRPFEAINFFDFMRRMAYYYVEFISTFFFFPIFFMLSKIPRRLRLFLATFLAIMTGGILVKVFEALHRVPIDGFREVLSSYSKFFMYYGLLSVILGISASSRKRSDHARAVKTSSRAHACIRSAKIIILYSVIISPLIGWSRVPHTNDEYINLFYKFVRWF